MSAYYNENDKKAAAWLRELVNRNLIAPGEVDERSIEDVRPSDLAGFRQHHFFAGIGAWSHALRLAGWPDDRPVWTGSCPCQPFSAAGKGEGFADERHLWPAFGWLIGQYRPGVVFGEQVAFKRGDAWFDVVSSDLEGEGYTCGSAVFPACGVGAPHLRQRRYWVAEPPCQERGRRGVHGRGEGDCEVSRPEAEQRPERGGVPGGLGQPQRELPGGIPGAGAKTERGAPVRPERDLLRTPGAASGAGPVNGFWGGADWLGCRDNKFRPVRPGTQPLAHGAPGRILRLRGYGNAIVATQAMEFIRAYMELE